MLSITKKCSVTDCRREHSAKGYCHLHYQRAKRGLPLEVHVLKPGPKVKHVACTLDNCDKEYYAKGFCSMHYARWKNGDEIIDRPYGKIDPSKKNVSQKGPCEGPECDRRADSKGLCKAHWQQRYVLKKELVPIMEREKMVYEEGRVCKRCRQFKPFEDYYLRSNKQSTQNECKKCMGARSSIRFYTNGKTQKRPDWAYDHLAWADSQNNLKGDKISV